MADAVLYIPVATTVFSLSFSAMIFSRYRRRAAEGAPAAHLLWWAGGIFVYGVGTFTEGFTSIFGWHEPIFRAWYISGALLGGGPLAQGTVYLILGRTWGHRTAAIAVTYVLVASVFVLLSPVQEGETVLSGRVFEWQWVRLFSPFINTYAFIFLVGGAIWSAYRFMSVRGADRRVLSNILIAFGALLPGIGGSSSRAGHTEVLYVTEFLGLCLIFAGYLLSTRSPLPRPDSQPG